MLLLLNLDTPRKQIDEIKNKIIENNCTPHEIPGESKLAVGITGPTNLLIDEEFEKMSAVEKVVRVTKKYKLVSREMKKDDTIIDFGNSKIGNRKLTVIAGPCSVENKDKTFEIAEILKKQGIEFFRAGAFKPRSSPYSFQGLKDEGLKILDEVKKEFELKIVTEVLNQNTVKEVAEVADILQIGTRNMQNYSLLEDVGNTGKPILLKRGMAATIEDLLLSAEYIASKNNLNIILCERGIRTFETSSRNTLDLNSVPILRNNSHLPVIVDPSHGIGIAKFVPDLALASIAGGANGLMIEVHQNPEEAYSDGKQTISPNDLEKLLNKIKNLAPIVDKEF